MRRLSAAVLREKLGDVQRDTHLCLMVTLDEPYLVNVGFGSSLRAPLPLREIEREDPPYTVSLTRVKPIVVSATVYGGSWRSTSRSGSGARRLLPNPTSTR